MGDPTPDAPRLTVLPVEDDLKRRGLYDAAWLCDAGFRVKNQHRHLGEAQP